MSSTAFRPYGLIKTPIEQALYHRAHIANIYTGIADPKESETSALMKVTLYSNVFSVHENFIVNSQQPPTIQSDKECDIVIRYLENRTQKIRILCFAECKRTRTSQPFSLEALERQAKDYAKEYLDHEDDMPFVYVATMADAHIRLWSYSREKAGLIPFWGPDDDGRWDQYRDVGDEKAGQEIEYCFERMKRVPPTPYAGQSSHTYGTATTDTTVYQASALDYPATTSGYPASSSEYPGYQTSSFAISHPLPSNAPMTTYPPPASQWGANVVMGGEGRGRGRRRNKGVRTQPRRPRDLITKLSESPGKLIHSSVMNSYLKTRKETSGQLHRRIGGKQSRMEGLLGDSTITSLWKIFLNN